MNRPFASRPSAAPLLVLLMVAGAVWCLSHWDFGFPTRTVDTAEFSVTRSARVGFGRLADNTSPSADRSGAGVESAEGAESSGTPRVDPGGQTLSVLRAQLDSGVEAHHESALASVEAAQSRDRISGLRRRLLMEAAGRALHSTTPWADLASVALAFKRAGDEESARYWFVRAARLALDPDDRGAASRALKEVVRHLLAARYLDHATELIARIPDAREKALAQAELVKTYARNGDFEEARNLAMSLSDVRAQGVALRSVAEAEARSEGLDSALRTLQMIGRTVERDQAFGAVASVRAAMGDPDGALLLVGKISNSRVRDTVVAKLATIQEKGGKISMEALVGLIFDPTFRDEVMRDVIVKEARRQGVDLAISSVDRIESEAERARAYESLVMLQIRQGDLDAALARAQSIHRTEVRFRALQAVAVAEVRSSGVVAARNVANLIGNRGVRESTFVKVAREAAVFGQHRGAVDTIGFIDSPLEKSLAFANVALTQARYGQTRMALQLVQDAQRELVRVESVRERARAQGVMAEVFAEAGDSNAAISTAFTISNAGLRDVTYQRMALSFARGGEPALATRSANLIERETVREKALSSIATILASRVPMTQAVRVASSLGGHRQQVRFLLGVAGRKS